MFNHPAGHVLEIAPEYEHVPAGDPMLEPKRHMAQALALAAEGMTLTSPNPRVGCVIVALDGSVLGQGHTQKAGGPHAEVMALRDAIARGYSVKGAVAYVTLEPCSHQGRTGPCCDALIAAGIKKVFASIADPNPLVSGQGIQRLQAAGIQVEVGLGAQASCELNLGFFSRMIRKKPWVRLKIATSMDGTSSLNNGISQWITCAESRADGHAWRSRSCAVLTGMGTVLKDNPLLNVRLPNAERQPHVVIVDSRLETPLNAQLFVPDRHVYIYTATRDFDRQSQLESRGATVIYMPGINGNVNLAAMLFDLGEKEINELHVEAGERLNGALVGAGLVDEFLLYLAPKLLGQGHRMAQFGAIESLSQAIEMEFKSIDAIGTDIRIFARILGRDNF